MRIFICNPISFLLLLFLKSGFLFGQSPGLNFVKTFGNYAYERGTSIVYDKSGNIIVVGYFEDTVDFDPSASTYTLTSNGEKDIFVSKYSRIGQLIWAFNVGSSLSENAHKVCIDSTGNIFITGSFFLTADFDPSISTANLTSVGLNDCFVAKYNSNGQYQWAFNIGSANSEEGHSIAIDASNNVIVSGSLYGTADFDPSPATAIITGGLYDMFTAKYSNNGQYIWAFKIASPNLSSRTWAIVCDTSRSIYLTGELWGGADFDPSPSTASITSAGSNDIFLAKYDKNGQYVWGFNIGGVGTQRAYDVGIDFQNNIYITGGFYGVVDFDPSPSTYTLNSGTFSANGFLAKYDASGQHLWAVNFGGNSVNTPPEGKTLEIDTLNNIYIGGLFNGIADFDPGPGVDSVFGYADIFIIKFTNTSLYKWKAILPGINILNDCLGMCLDDSANIYITGYFKDTLDFDPYPGMTKIKATALAQDMYIAKYSCLNPVAPINTTIPVKQTVCEGKTTTLSATSSGNVKWYSSSTATNVLGTGFNYVTSPTLSAGTYTYYTETQICESSLTRTPITFTIIPSPSLTITGTSTLCLGSTITLTAAGAPTFTWSTSSNSYTTAITPTTTTIYTVSGTGINGCISSITQTVNVFTPTLSISGLNSICLGNTLTLTVNGALSYTWNTSSNNTSISVTPTATSTYSASGTDVNGCQNSAIKTVTVNTLPNVAVTTSNSLICVGQNATLTASGANTYTWSTSSTGVNIVVNPTITTAYSVIGTNTIGCVNSFTINQAVSLCSSLKENKKDNEFSVFPNPVNNFLTISLPSCDNMEIIITNINGLVILRHLAVSNNFEIKLDNIDSGMYFVVFYHQGQNVLTKKIIKQ